MGKRLLEENKNKSFQLLVRPRGGLDLELHMNGGLVNNAPSLSPGETHLVTKKGKQICFSDKILF